MLDFTEIYEHGGSLYAVVRDEDCTRIDCRTLLDGDEFEADIEMMESEND